jgi:hypothetical protein
MYQATILIRIKPTGGCQLAKSGLQLFAILSLGKASGGFIEEYISCVNN